MWVRVTTLQGDPSRIDEAIAYCRDEAFPKINAMDGSLGGVIGAVESSGEVMVMTAWKDREALDASLSGILGYRNGVSDVLGATSTTVELFELAVIANCAPGRSDEFWVRSTRVELPSGDMDELVQCYREKIAPRFETFAGARMAMLFIDREHGVAVFSASYDDHDALTAADERAEELRGLLITDVPSIKVVAVTAMRCVVVGLRPA